MIGQKIQWVDQWSSRRVGEGTQAHKTGGNRAYSKDEKHPKPPALQATLQWLWSRDHFRNRIHSEHTFLLGFWMSVNELMREDHWIVLVCIETLNETTRTTSKEIAFWFWTFAWLDGFTTFDNPLSFRFMQGFWNTSLVDRCWRILYQFCDCESIANIELGKYGYRINLNVQGSEILREIVKLIKCNLI